MTEDRDLALKAMREVVVNFDALPSWEQADEGIYLSFAREMERQRLPGMLNKEVHDLESALQRIRVQAMVEMGLIDPPRRVYLGRLSLWRRLFRRS